jgi:hypothetical protein
MQTYQLIASLGYHWLDYLALTDSELISETKNRMDCQNAAAAHCTVSAWTQHHSNTEMNIWPELESNS